MSTTVEWRRFDHATGQVKSKMNKYFIGFIFFLFGLLGCAKPFQPVPPLFLLWSKDGTDVVGVKKALLECGYPNPYDGVDREWVNGKLISHTNLDDSVMSEMCMRKNAFTKKSRGLCESIANLQICMLKNPARIPERNVDRRLNSRFCIQGSDPSICKP